jgi:hypothetical protein
LLTDEGLCLEYATISAKFDSFEVVDHGVEGVHDVGLHLLDLIHKDSFH